MNQHKATHPRAQQRGLTIVEIAVSIVVLSVASLFSLGVTVSSARLDKVNREESSSTAIVQRLVEEMRSVPFDQLYATFNKDPNDDPDGAGTAPGHKFRLYGDDNGSLMLSGSKSWNREDESDQVTGGSWDAWWNSLTADEQALYKKQKQNVAHDGDAMSRKGLSKTRRKFRRLAVKVRLKWPDSSNSELKETKRMPLLGDHQWDLNGDGVIDKADHRHDYKILPVIIELKWKTTEGTRVFQVAHVFSTL